MQTIKPVIPIISNPIGIERVVEDIRELFTALQWLDFSLPLAKIVLKRDKKQPSIYIGESDYDFLGINDNHKAFCFFYEEDPAKYLNFQDNPFQKQMLNCVFFCNLALINNEPEFQRDYQKYLIYDVCSVLNGIKTIDKVSVYSNNLDRILESFDKSLFNENWFLFPNTVFRISFEATFYENCFPSFVPNFTQC